MNVVSSYGLDRLSRSHRLFGSTPQTGPEVYADVYQSFAPTAPAWEAFQPLTGGQDAGYDLSGSLDGQTPTAGGYDYLAQVLARMTDFEPAEQEPTAPIGNTVSAASTEAVGPAVGRSAFLRSTGLRTTGPVRPTSAVAPTAPVVRPGDTHIPKLEEVFQLARNYPGKTIMLDAKLPPGKPEVARRMAQQMMELLRKYPEMRDRVMIMTPDQGGLDAMKQEFGRCNDFRDFKNFSLDNENLNKRNPTAAERSPLTNSGDNRYVSIGNPRSPLTSNNFSDLVEEVRKARTEIDRNGSAHAGKKILAWTLNDPAQIRQVVQAGADGIVTDNPDMMNRTLDSMGYGARGLDPRRPEVIAHRGGPNSPDYPENTLPAVEQGLRRADAIEIDIVSAKDGLVLYHDNDPNALISTVRNTGLEASNDWRPVYPDLGSDARGKRLDELTIDEIRANYGYERNATHSPIANGVLSVLSNVARAPGTALNWLGKYLSIGKFNPLGWAGTALNWAVDTVGKPIFTGIAQAADQVVTGGWNGLKTIGSGLVGGVKDIFSGRIGKGLLGIGKGLVKGAGQIVGGIIKGAGSILKGAAKAVGGFFKKLFG